MDLLTHARRMARYNRWMNGKLYASCAQLTDAQRKEDVGAFFRSIHGTLNHLLVADRLWMGRFTGEPFVVQSLAQELYADFDALRFERARTDEEIVRWFEALDAARLDDLLEYTSMVNPAPRRIGMDLAVTHFFNHQTHHRGQVTTLLSQRGIDPGVTDLMWLDD
jgi:uncharacterized damage-inducible protein DinB